MKRYFTAFFVFIFIIVFYYMWTLFMGSPFYKILAKKSVCDFTEQKYYGYLEYVSTSYEDSKYCVTVKDRENHEYKMIYYPETNTIQDGYYEESVMVMKQLVRNKIRQIIKVNTDVSIDTSDISIDATVPQFVYKLGSMGSAFDCSFNTIIRLSGHYESIDDFANTAYKIMLQLKRANIGIKQLNISSEKYYICVEIPEIPTDELSTLFLVLVK